MPQSMGGGGSAKKPKPKPISAKPDKGAQEGKPSSDVQYTSQQEQFFGGYQVVGGVQVGTGEDINKKASGIKGGTGLPASETEGGWKQGTKTGKWAQGATGQWQQGAEGPWAGTTTTTKKKTGGTYAGGGGGDGRIRPRLEGTRGGGVSDFRGARDLPSRDGVVEYVDGNGEVTGGAGGGGGGTGSPFAPGLSETVRGLGLRSSSLEGKSVEETISRGARRTRKTGQKRSL
jgi:hypothetical protein